MKNTSYGRGSGYGRGSQGSPRSFRPKPVEMGKEYDVTITEISRRGDGIARVEGFVIFVPQAKAGQRTRIKIVQVGNRYANGQIVETVEKEEKSE